MTRYLLIILTMSSFALTACDEPPGNKPVATTTPAATGGVVDPNGPPPGVVRPTNPSTDTSPSKTADLSLTGFDSIKAQGNCDVTVLIGEPKVTIECNEKSFDKIKATTSGKELIITADGVDASKANVTVTMPDLETFTATNFIFGHLKDFKGDKLTLTTKDQSTIDGTGSVDTLTGVCESASSLRLRSLIAKNANVKASGKCFAELNVTDSCVATATESAVVTIDGNPKQFEKHASGNAIINKPQN